MLGSDSRFSRATCEVLASEFPFEGPRRRFPVVLKIEQSLSHGFEVREVIRGENLALHDGEVDLDLIQPTGMDEQASLQALDCPRFTMGGTVIDDPEHSPSSATAQAPHAR